MWYTCRCIHVLCVFIWPQDLEKLEMVFDKEEKGGGGIMKPAAAKNTEFGALPEPYVILHAMNSSE